MQGNK